MQTWLEAKEGADLGIYGETPPWHLPSNSMCETQVKGNGLLNGVRTVGDKLGGGLSVSKPQTPETQGERRVKIR